MSANIGTKIDIYCHIFPDRFFREMTKVAPKLENMGKRLRGITKLFDLDARFEEMDEYGDYRQIVSLPNPPIEDIATPDVGIALARIANDCMAELCAQASRALSHVRRGAVPDRRRGLGQGSTPRHQRARRARRADLHRRRRRAARPAEVRADLCGGGGTRRLRLAASRAHRGHDRLPCRAEIALRIMVVPGLALRHLGGDDPHGVVRAVRPPSEAEDHHASSRRHDPLLRRADRAGLAGAGRAHVGRGLFARCCPR